MRTVKTILIVVANPRNNSERRLEIEVREIATGLNLGLQREQFRLEQQWAVDSTALRRAMLKYNPQIVHFCGYGIDSQGLELEHEQGGVHLVGTNALSELFSLFSDRIECVVLSACYSELQALAISQHVDYVVGMNSSISHAAATKFSIGFYDALSAGRSYEQAFQFGKNAIELDSILEHSIPVLKRNRLVSGSIKGDASTILILEDNELWLARHERRLKTVGFKCHATQWAEEAIRIAKIDSSVKFVLVDEVLFVPTVTTDTKKRSLQRWQGSGVIREIAPLRPDIQFVMVTSAPEERSKGSSKAFRRESHKLRSLPSVIDVFHRQDIQESPESTYEKLIHLLNRP